MGEHTDLKVLTGKVPLQCLVPGFLWEVALVMGHGNTKYAPDNWKGGFIHQLEYVGAALRHVFKYWSGESHDSETGLSHLAHAACSLMFLWWYDNRDALPNHSCVCTVCTGR